MKSFMKKDVLRSLIIVITLALALGLLGTSAAQRKTGSKVKTPQPQIADCGNTDVDSRLAVTNLVAGNGRWRGTMTQREWSLQRHVTALCQKPFAVVIACMDSRVPPELIFDQGLGELFVIRVAGPVLDKDQLGSLEYALAVKNVKLVVVLGHTDCGAVKGAAAGGPGGPYLPDLLRKIDPAVEYVVDHYNRRERIGPDDATNLNRVSIANARDVAHLIPTFNQSGVLVTFGLYDTASGAVDLAPREPWLH